LPRRARRGRGPGRAPGARPRSRPSSCARARITRSRAASTSIPASAIFLGRPAAVSTTAAAARSLPRRAAPPLGWTALSTGAALAAGTALPARAALAALAPRAPTPALCSPLGWTTPAAPAPRPLAPALASPASPCPRTGTSSSAATSAPVGLPVRVEAVLEACGIPSHVCAGSRRNRLVPVRRVR